MKFTERTNGLYLENIKKEDIRFANLGGRMTGSRYDDPNKPKHEYIVWLDSNDLIDVFLSKNVTVAEKINDDTGESQFSVRFKAYPKMRLNRKINKEEQYPKVMLKTGDKVVRLEKSSFGLVDSAHIKNVDIKFHLYQYDERKPNCIAVIDELWCVVDETAGYIDDTYLEEKYCYADEDRVTGED